MASSTASDASCVSRSVSASARSDRGSLLTIEVFEGHDDGAGDRPDDDQLGSGGVGVDRQVHVGYTLTAVIRFHVHGDASNAASNAAAHRLAEIVGNGQRPPGHGLIARQSGRPAELQLPARSVWVVIDESLPLTERLGDVVRLAGDDGSL